MKKTANLTSFFVSLFIVIALFSFAGIEQVRAVGGSVTLPGFEKATDALNKAVTPSNIENLGGSRTSGLVPCGYQETSVAAQDCQFSDFIILVKNVMNFLLFVIAVPIAAISFAWAGWLYMSARGDEGNIKKTHEIFSSVVLGLSLALGAWLIVNAIIIGLGVGAKYNFLGTT